jgi:hypothetical protein
MPESDRIIGNTQIKDFPGLRTNADPLDLKPGEMVSQVNCGGPVPGKLRSRAGLVFVDFADGNGGTTSTVTVAMPYATPFGQFVIYQRADGYVILGKNPA